MPTMRGRNQLDAPSGAIPRPANGKLSLAWSATMRTSIGSVIVSPTPTADPLMAPITGLRESKIRSTAMPPPSRGARGGGPSSAAPARLSRLKVSAPLLRSAPAQNARPAPVTMTTRTASSASVRSKAAQISRSIVPVNALR